MVVSQAIDFSGKNSVFEFGTEKLIIAIVYSG